MQTPARINVVVKEPGKSAESREMYPEWGNYTKVVDGPLGIAMRAPGFFKDGKDLMVYCNDNFLAEGLPLNFYRSSDRAPVAGTVVAIKYDRNYDQDLTMTGEEISKTVQLLHEMEGHPDLPDPLMKDSFQYERPPTPYAVICSQHGQVFLSEDEYDYQMNQPNSTWKCPICGARAGFDDDNFEASLSDAPQYNPDED